MLNSREQLGQMVKSHREHHGWTQDQLVAKLEVKANRSVVAHLEQGLRIPKPDALREICQALSIPGEYWEPFASEDSLQRFAFEEALSELVGYSVTLDGHDQPARAVAERQINDLFSESGSVGQTFDRFNSILIYYGAKPVSAEFFGRYLSPQAFSSVLTFEAAIKSYQKEAVRLFSTLAEAYRLLNRPNGLDPLLEPLKTRTLERYSDRTEWDAIEQIEDARLPDLGYISAARVKQESAEREALKRFLEALAKSIRKDGAQVALDKLPTKTRRRMDSLLRQFRSTLEHGLFSPLFAPDPNEIEREAQRLAPKTDEELTRMANTQATAMRNLARYLSADHMDLYVATSMRSDADFVSVNHFVQALFDHDKVRPLKLRYFNPTQSWIEDRVAKGLVEALMLRRADITIYMAQKSDTFGKDSEASVALGQGKPVIVYVPKLSFGNGGTGFDTEALFRRPRAELIGMLEAADRQDIDEAVDDQAVVSRILNARLEKLSDEDLTAITLSVWADFDLHNEADRVGDDATLKADYRNWLDAVIQERTFSGDFGKIRQAVIGILVANAIRFEARAKVFREIHPLALQVILSSGVLNGILVVRSGAQCAEVLSALIRNELEVALYKDEHNYRLVEELTGSTIRVISRHRLLRHSFENFYGRQ